MRRAYEASLSQIPDAPGLSKEQIRQRRISWLNLSWFMQTLLNRMDRAARYSDLDARVPFADTQNRRVCVLCSVGDEGKRRSCQAAAARGGKRADSGGDFISQEIALPQNLPP